MKELTLKKTNNIVLLDDVDYERVKNMRWIYSDAAGPFRRYRENGKQRSQMMSHFILGLTQEQRLLVKYKDGNNCNLQRENMYTISRADQGRSIAGKVKAKKIAATDGMSKEIEKPRRQAKAKAAEQAITPQAVSMRGMDLLPVPHEDGIHYVPMQNIAYLSSDRNGDVFNVVLTVQEWDNTARRPQTVSFAVMGEDAERIQEFIRLNSNANAEMAVEELMSLRAMIAQAEAKQAEWEQSQRQVERERDHLRDELRQVRKQLKAFTSMAERVASSVGGDDD